MQPILPSPCKYGAVCYNTRPEHLNRFSHNLIAKICNSTLPICKFGANCDVGNSRHYAEQSHPNGPCANGAACNSHNVGHALNFAHTPDQRAKVLSDKILSNDTGPINTIKFKDMLTHSDLETLYNCSTAQNLHPLVNGTGFSKGFLKAAFLHGAYIASKQLQTIKNVTAIVVNEQNQQMELETIGTLCETGKIEFAFGPSRHALECVSKKLSTQKVKTIAPFGHPHEGFKWAEMKETEGLHTFDKRHGVHLLTGCYHSTSNSSAAKIFNEVTMVGGGYLGNGMYFTVAPTKDAKADDQDAALKTSSYGFSSGGAIVVALVVGHDGILYVKGSDDSVPQASNWDLKYLPKGIKPCNIGNSDEKNHGGAELVATNPAQVLPLGIVYIKTAGNCSSEVESRKELLNQLAANAKWLKST